MIGQELEVKFYLQDLPRMENRLVEAGAQLIQPRVFERNLRFDTLDGSLTREQRVLRLRQDVRAHLTYKGPADPQVAVSARQEIEFGVDDFNAAQQLLEALGYQVSVMYEKFRTTYHFQATEVVLDEMPFGNFLEIEGPDADTIRQAAIALELNWDGRCTDSYMSLFERLRRQGLEAAHLNFALLNGKTYTAADFGLQPGDC